MKIIFLINSVQNQRCIKRVNEFIENGYDVDVYAFSRGFEMRNTCLTKINIIGTFPNGYPYQKRLKIIYLSFKRIIDLYYKKRVLYYVFSLDLAMIFRLLSRTLYIYEESDLTHTYLKFPIKNILEKIDKKIIRDSFISIFTSEGFLKYHFSDKVPNNCFIISNRLDPTIQNLFYQNNTTFDKNRIRIGFVGQARFNSIVNFSKIVCSHFSNVEIHIYGNISTNFQKLFTDLLIYDNFFIHGAFKNPDDLPKIYSNLDLVLSTYDVVYDNVRFAEPNKLYESIYFETPIIVTENTYLSDKVNLLGIGCSVDPLNEASVVNLVKTLNFEFIEKCKVNCRNIGKEYCLNYNNDFFLHLNEMINNL